MPRINKRISQSQYNKLKAELLRKVGSDAYWEMSEEIMALWALMIGVPMRRKPSH